MPARVCPHCKTPWPPRRNDVVAYTTCPECEEQTVYQTAEKPIHGTEAASRADHAEFARFYISREQERRERGEPSPEDVAHAELEPWLAELGEIRELPEAA